MFPQIKTNKNINEQTNKHCVNKTASIAMCHTVYTLIQTVLSADIHYIQLLVWFKTSGLWSTTIYSWYSDFLFSFTLLQSYKQHIIHACPFPSNIILVLIYDTFINSENMCNTWIGAVFSNLIYSLVRIHLKALTLYIFETISIK